MVEIRKATPIAAFEDEYDKLEAIVGEARWILDLVDNFDGRGSPRYSEETFERAVAFVKLQWQEYLRLNGDSMPLPEIQPGPRGSIDVFWDHPGLNLLVNIPADARRPAEFSGDNQGERRFDGTLDPAQPNRGLVSWLSA